MNLIIGTGELGSDGKLDRVYALYKRGFFSILGGLSLVMDSLEGEMTPGKKNWVEKLNGFQVMSVLAFLVYLIYRFL